MNDCEAGLTFALKNAGIFKAHFKCDLAYCFRLVKNSFFGYINQFCLDVNAPQISSDAIGE